jgi:acetyl-CoA decarbonylase/synthase complex subunit gamma
MVRLGIRRMSYTVVPGLYALGGPGEDSPVLVTANYKLSFDHLRRELAGIAAWVLVLDTHGINVWCAAGKGTFGTGELIRQVRSCGLDRIVNHRRLVVPQLGAPGIAAHQVKKACGFEVVYGPVMARDLPAFIDNGFRATPAMRLKSFPLAERMVLIPVEFFIAVKWGLLLAVCFALAAGFLGTGTYLANIKGFGGRALLNLMAGVGAGTVLTPILLPILPGRAFSVKGLAAGLLGWGIIFLTGSGPGSVNRPELIGWLLLIAAVSSFLGMQFTGASTYTSLSGVKKEMRYAVPCQIAAAFAGVVLLLASRLV